MDIANKDARKFAKEGITTKPKNIVIPADDRKSLIKKKYI